MKQQMLSVALALCLCTSSLPAVRAGQEVLSPQEDVLTEEAASELILCDESGVPTPTEVYEAMIALQEDERYKEGTPWTDNGPDSGATPYHWKGGTINGDIISATGCVAFAFILSDAAFDSLPNRMFATDEFAFEDIKVGDILRVNNDAHTVIVLRVTDGGVVVAEGNYSGTIHWGRALSKEEVMSNTSHYITRYPKGYVVPDDPAASVIIDEGNLDGGLTWRLTGAGTLTVSGNGAMPDFSGTQEQPWSSYSDQILTVNIEEGVTSIGAYAFCECGVLSAKISSTVTSIGTSAFRESSIVSMSIPPSVKTIGDDAFRECLNLTSLTVSEGGESIGERAFQGCIKLASVNLPASIKSMGAGAFYDCEELSSVIFASGSNNNPVTMGANLFARCWKLSTVTLPERIDCISNEMFQNCYYALYSVSIPQGATKIGESAFASCSVLTYLTIPDSVTDIESGAFSGCSSLTEIRFTGTEEQWQKIWKANNVTEALANVTIRYNYIPTTDPDEGDDNDDSNTPGTPGSGDETDPDTPGSGDVTDPDTPGSGDETDPDTPGSGDETDPDTPGSGDETDPDTPGSGDETDPDTPGSGDVTDPDTPGSGDETDPDTPGSGDETDPDTPDTGDTTNPGDTTTPDVTPEPDATPDPDATAAPDVTAAPDPAPVPDDTPVPDPVPVPTPVPDPVPVPTPVPDPVPVPTPVPDPVPVPTPVPDPTPVPVPEPDTRVPFIKGESGKVGWEVIRENAINAFEGQWITVNMNGISTVPGNVIDSIKEKNATLAFDMGNGLTWFVNGKNVTADHANDVDLSVQAGTSAIPQNLVEGTAGSRQATQLSLAYSGYFGYSAVLMIDLGSANAGLYANLYYYNETNGALEFVTVDQINEDGIAELVFSHASDYVIVVGEDVMGGNSNGTSSGSNNGSASANSDNSQGTGVRSPKTGEYDTVIGGANAAELQHKGNNLMWLFFIGAAMMSVMGTITVLISRKGNK